MILEVSLYGGLASVTGLCVMVVGVDGEGLLIPCWLEIHPGVKGRWTDTGIPVLLLRAHPGNFLLDPIS